jgi:two-component system response regulator NreC
MKSILIADDHQLMIEGYRLLIGQIDELEIVGMAYDGQEAIDKVAELKPDFLLLDLHMSKVNGLDVLRYVAEYCPTTRSIIISMYGDPSIHKEAVRLGASGYILKHADQEEFILALELALQGKGYYSAEIFDAKPALEDVPHITPLMPFVPLTQREGEVLALIAKGYTNKEIAGKLFVSYKTVDSHRTNLMKKLNAHNVTSLVRYALANGYEI